MQKHDGFPSKDIPMFSNLSLNSMSILIIF